MSRLIAFLVAFTLVVTSQAFALARGQAAAADEMVICANGGFVTITVDAEGKPTGPAHVCPDALAALGATGAVPLVSPVVWNVAGTIAPPAVVAVLPGRDLPHVQARAPPVGV